MMIKDFKSNSNQHINLRGTPCPLNFIKCRLAVEKLASNQLLEVDLDRGEPEEMVIPGLIESGHQVQIVFQNENWMKLMVNPGCD